MTLNIDFSDLTNDNLEAARTATLKLIGGLSKAGDDSGPIYRQLKRIVREQNKRRSPEADNNASLNDLAKSLGLTVADDSKETAE